MTGFDMSAIERELEEQDRKERPRKERLEKIKRESPRVIYRDDGRGFMGTGRPRYEALRLADLGYTGPHVETYSYLGDRTKRTRKRGPEIHLPNHVYPAARLGEIVRRPTAAGLRRLEEAEAALLEAQKAVREARRHAFTYGKPVPLSAVQEITRRKKAAYKEGAE